MKKYLVFILVLVSLIGCASTGGGGNPGEITGKEWKLIEVNIESTPFSRKVIYDRSALKKENIANVYTINFDAGRLSGIGAPNRYSAPYTLMRNS